MVTYPSRLPQRFRDLRKKQFPATRLDRYRCRAARSSPCGCSDVSLCSCATHIEDSVGTMRPARCATISDDDENCAGACERVRRGPAPRKIHLGYSTRVRAPITFGVVTPCVLFPIEAGTWSTERRRTVLIHEASHVARGDWLSQMIGQIACTLFWFHPLAWYASARMRDEAERAADDCVLGSGMPARWSMRCTCSSWRAARARLTPEPVAVGATGIVSTHHLERRFVAMFDTKRSRTTVTSRVRAVTASVALAIVCPFAAVRVGGSALPSPRLASSSSHIGAAPVAAADGARQASGRWRHDAGRPRQCARWIDRAESLDAGA